MASRRLFSPKVVDTDAFLDMPHSSQLLYFHLGMRADDDGFVSNPKKIMRMIGNQDDDLKILLAKKFVIGFDSGVVVIKHWLIHNTIRKDRYIPTQWVNEMKSLEIDEKTKKYSITQPKLDLRQPVGNQAATTRQPKLSKVKSSQVNLSKVNTIAGKPADEINQVMEIFYKTVNPSINYGNKTTRKAVEWLINKLGLEKTIELTQYAVSVQGEKYAPTITTPYQLKEKLGALKIYADKNNIKTHIKI